MPARRRTVVWGHGGLAREQEAPLPAQEVSYSHRAPLGRLEGPWVVMTPFCPPSLPSWLMLGLWVGTV